MTRRLVSIKIVSVLMLASCSTTQMATVKRLDRVSSKPVCATELAEIRDDHETARVSACKVISDDYFQITIRPEKATDPKGDPINNSAWYGFRIDPLQKDTLKVRLKYENGKHRYHPKISYDGTNWEFLSESQIAKINENEVQLNFPKVKAPFFISGQEIFTPTAHNKWTVSKAKSPDVSMSKIGESREGRPIYMLEVQTEPDKKKPYVVWIGRQHPPEVTGALALIPFTETVLDNSELSKEFLKNFNALIIPMINPDGVINGNWRFNMDGTDLNRDWGPFSQPETQAVRDAFKRFETGKDDIAFFLDFHSTWRNLLYTQADDEPTSPPMFARDWLKAVDDRLDDDVYPFTREARHNSGKPISKNYMYDTYGISAITYEVGDATPRSAIDLSASVFAQEMMKLLLKHEADK